MEFFDEQVLVKARGFIRASLPADGTEGDRPILIAYHGDGEGCCAAYFLKTYLGRSAVCYWVPTPDFDFVSFPSQDLLKEIAKRVHVSFLIQDINTTHYALDFLARARESGGFGQEQVMRMREYQVLENIYDLVQNEKHWLMKKLWGEIKKLAGPQFIVKRVESTMRISGLIASELRWKYPGLVIGIWQRWKGRYYCELRRGKSAGVNLVSLVERIKSEVDLKTGGGHPAAAAFTAEGDRFFEALDRVKHCLAKPALLQE